MPITAAARILSRGQPINNFSDEELKLIPEAGASIFVFYLGVQAQRFDWSNIFLTENYLKMFVGRIKNWLDYYEEKNTTSKNSMKLAIK